MDETAPSSRPPPVQGLLQGVQHKAGLGEREARQPTMRRANTSMTNAAQTKPDQVATYVKSDTHNAWGRGALNSRSTRSRGQAIEGSGTVVRTFLPRTTPRSPMTRIRRATVQRATPMPSRPSYRHTFLSP